MRVASIYRKRRGAELATAKAGIDLLTTTDTLIAFEVVTADLRHVLRGLERAIALWQHNTPDAWFIPEQWARIAEHGTPTTCPARGHGRMICRRATDPARRRVSPTRPQRGARRTSGI